jgi:hypothetical protein
MTNDDNVDDDVMIMTRNDDDNDDYSHSYDFMLVNTRFQAKGLAVE